MELKRFRANHRSVEVVEEQKKQLQNKLTLMEDLRSELREAQLQRQILEDERSSWTSYLQDQTSVDGIELRSPEDLARALVRERLEAANLVEKLGILQSELLDRDQNFASLKSRFEEARKELEKLKSIPGTAGIESNTKKRLERQRVLAVKEVEFLRQQLRSFETEETTFQPEATFDEQKSKRIQDLEILVDDYRTELSKLNASISELEKRASTNLSSDPNAPSPPSRKRAHEEEEDDASNQFGNLSRKNRKLQDDLSTLQAAHSVLNAEHSATLTQLNQLQQSSKTRVLALKSNPTSNFEAIKVSTLKSLEAENKALLARLDTSAAAAATAGTAGEETVPKQTLERIHREADALRVEIADKSKRELRLKQIWSLKSLEFREAVASLLGWKMNFLPNGRFSMTSIFNEGLNPSSVSEDDGGETNAIIFDGDTGTMKVSGGPDGAFGKEIRGSIDYWVKGRNEIPCFMAALTMEFYERTTRAARA